MEDDAEEQQDEMDRLSQEHFENALQNWEESYGHEFTPDVPPPPYTPLPDSDLIENEAPDAPPRLEKPCVVPRRSP